MKDTKNHHAFTLIELLTVVAIIGILVGILLPIVNKARLAAWRARARDGVNQVATAWKTYLNDYRSFPNTTIEEMNTNAMDILGSTGTVYNTRYVYMDFTTNEWNKGYCDPWGELYQVRLDTDYDGEIATPHGTVKKDVAVWSKGQDRLDGSVDEQKDDVKSWQ